MESAALAPFSMWPTRRRCAVIAVAMALCASSAFAQQGNGMRGLMGDLQRELQSLDTATRAARASSSPTPTERTRVIGALDRVRALDLLLEDEQRRLDAKFLHEGASPVVIQRHADNQRLIRERLDRVYRAAAPFVARSDVPDLARDRAALDAILEALAGVVDTSARAPIGVTLPYRSLAFPQMAPQFSATITPAYLTSPVVPPLAADLAETLETRFTPAIRAKAAALSQDPIAIFEFVQNDIRNAFYYGAMNDASETLRQAGGNDADQASLLIALLRASRIPARYVRGVVRLTGPQAMAWSGVGSTRRAAEIFTRAGIPFRPILQGGTIGAFEIEHTWVEAYVPYSNYRGVRLGSIGRAWIPLDPSFQSLDVNAGVDVLDAAGFHAENLVGNFLLAIQDLLPLEWYQDTIADYLAEHRPELTLAQVLAAVTGRTVTSGLLPSTLPYAIASINQEGPELPDALRHRVRFAAAGDDGLSFDVTLAAAELAGHRLTLSYAPATVDDQAAAHAFLGLDNTPAYLVKLRPLLKLDGVVKAAGSAPIQMGAFHSFIVELQTPRGVAPIASSVLAGGYYAVGLASQPAAYEIPLARAPDDTEHPAADRLYSIAIDYIARWNAAEQDLERLLRVVNVRPTLSHVMVGTSFARTVVFGQPQAIDWRGVFVDADLRVSEPVPTGTIDSRAREFRRLSGLQGSALEADVLRSNLHVDAVSASSVIQLARTEGIPIEEVTAANLTEVLARLQTADVVKTEIADAVNQGWRVTIPRRDLTRNIWSGIGYVMIDPATGAGGYFISGGLAGGSTTQPPAEWPDQPLAEALAGPNATPPNTDPAAARYITKVAVTDKQNGVVGQRLPQALAVWVRDEDGVPVRDALVTFTSEIGGGLFGTQQTATAFTNYLGIAKAELTLGTSTATLPFYVLANPDDQHTTQVGQNIVSASVTGTAGEVALLAPFQFFAYPGEPHHLTRLQGEGNTVPVGTAAGTVRVRVADAFENPISNSSVSFIALPIPQTPLPADAVNVTMYPSMPACAIPMPVIGQCGATTQQQASSTVFGASVEAIAGNLSGADFQIRASAAGTSPVVFTINTSGTPAFPGPITHEPTVLLSLLHLTRSDGQLLDATQVGTVYPRPLGASLYLFEPNYVFEPTDFFGCQTNDLPCFHRLQTGTHRTRAIDMHHDGANIEYRNHSGIPVLAPKGAETATVRFRFPEGAGAGTLDPAVPPGNPGNGQYFTTFTAGQEPRLNLIEVGALASVWIPRFDLDFGTVHPQVVDGVFAGGHVTFDNSNRAIINGAPAPVTHRVFAVRGTVTPPSVHVTSNGITSETSPLRYTIEPPAYQASTAAIDLFRTEPNGDEVWLGFIPGSQLSGDQGSATLLQGVGLEPDRPHQAQLVLNRGTEAEIRSDKAPVRLLAPPLVLTSGTRVTTYLDRVNQSFCDVPASFPLILGRDARVTITVGGVPFTDANGILYLNREMTASVRDPGTGVLIAHQIPVTALQVAAPGRHAVGVTAVFDEPDPLEDLTATAQATIVHDIVISAVLPVGHTIVKGVDVFDGHYTLTREDFSIPGVGPSLSFSRSYSSIGHRSSGIMGAGWAHTFDAKVIRDPCGAVVLIGGEGSGIRFTESPQGVFTPQAGHHGTLSFNAADGSYDFFTKQRTRYHYEPAPPTDTGIVHRLTFIEDPNGNRVALAYDPAAPFNLQAVSDASGRTLTLTYTMVGQLPDLAEPRLTRINGPLGLEVTYSYDPTGNLIGASRGGRAETYLYDTANVRDGHNLVRIVGPNNAATAVNGDIIDIAYFSDSDTIPGESPNTHVFPEKWEFVRSVTEGAGTPSAAAYQFSYDYSNFATHILTTIVDPRSISTQYTIHPYFGAVLEKRVRAGSTDVVARTEWAFQNGINDVNVTRTIDPNGRVTNFTYDSRGNPTREAIEAQTVAYAAITNAQGSPVTQSITTYDYHPLFNKVTRKVDPEGNVTDYGLDAAGNLATVTTYPGNGQPPAVTTYTYTSAHGLHGLMATMTDPGGHVTRYENFDAFGNARRIVDAEDNVATTTYDERGRVTERADTLGHHTTYAYDVLDRATSSTATTTAQPADLSMASVAQRTTTTEWFPGGQVRSKTLPNGHTTTYEYDALNREVAQRDTVIDADGVTSSLAILSQWDGNGNRTASTDRRGLTRTYSYDQLNRLTETRLEGHVVATNTYDPAGNRLTEADLHGHLTRYDYDQLYRRAVTHLPLAPYQTSTTFDRLGNVLSQIDANGHAVHMTYDGLSRMLSETNAVGVTRRYAYDSAGNRTVERNLATGLEIRSTFDGIKRPTSVEQRFADPLTGELTTYTTTIDYLDAEHATHTTNPRGAVSRERYNGHDELIEREIDPNGLRLLTTYRYDGAGNRTAQKDAEGGVIDVEGGFDGLNRRIRATYPLGGQDRWFYDGNGNVVRSVDSRGIERRFAYDHLDRTTQAWLVESLSNGGNELLVSSMTYEDTTGATTLTDANANATRQEFDAVHRPLRAVDAVNQSIRVEWDGVNKVAEVDRRGIRTEFVYDHANRLIEQRRLADDASIVSSVEHVDSENRTIATDPAGVATVIQMDALQRVRRIAVRHASLADRYGATEIVAETREYDGVGNVTATSDANGHFTRFEYDGGNRRVRVIEAVDTAVETSTTYTYDRAGNVLTVKDGRAHDNGFDIRYTYDVRNRKVLDQDAVGSITAYTYDQANNLQGVIEPRGGAHRTTYTYGERNELVAIDDSRGGSGGVTRYMYDANGNRIAQQDADGNLTTYRYDALNRLIQTAQHTVAGSLTAGRTRTQGPGGDEATARAWSYGYDANGNQTSIVDAAGQEVVSSYDGFDRMRRREYRNHQPGADGNAVYPNPVHTDYRFDLAGNLIRSEETKQVSAGEIRVDVTTSSYDRLNRQVASTNADGKSLAFEHDRNGNQTAVVDADGTRTTYGFDALNRVASVTQGADTTSYTYWPDGLQRSVALPNGVTSETTYDAADRVRRITNHTGDDQNPLSRFEYAYDANGNRISQTERHARLNGGATQTTTYQYDALNRLTVIDYPGNAGTAYTYSRSGNRLNEQGVAPFTDQAAHRSYAYNRLNQITAIHNLADPSTSLVFEYDRNGNTLRKKTGALDPDGAIPSPTSVTSYAWNIRDHLASVDGSPAGPLRFDYDWAGQRIKADSAFAAIRFLNDGATVLQEYEGATLNTTLKYGYGPGALLSIAPSGGNRLFYLRDALGSTSELVDGGGQVQASYSYDAWGKSLASFDTTPNRRTFTGQYTDTETGLHYFGARYYDDATGRFLSQDAWTGDVGEPATLHRYLYAHANPLRFIDPTGYAAEDTTAASDQAPVAEDAIPTFSDGSVLEAEPRSHPCARLRAATGIGGECFVWNNQIFATDIERLIEEDAIEQKARAAGAEVTARIDATLKSEEYKQWRFKWQKQIDLAEILANDPTANQGWGFFGQLARDWQKIGRNVDYQLNRWEIENPSWLKSKVSVAVSIAMETWVDRTQTMRFGEGIAEAAETGDLAPVLSDAFRGIDIVTTVAPILGAAGRGIGALSRAPIMKPRMLPSVAQVQQKLQARRAAAVAEEVEGLRQFRKYKSAFNEAQGDINPTRGNMNCRFVCIAQDAALEGRRVVAPGGPVGPASFLANHFNNTWSINHTLQSLEAKLLNAGPGAKGIVFGRRTSAPGHFYNVANIDGRIRYFDAQPWEAPDFSNYQFSDYWFLRTKDIPK